MDYLRSLFPVSFFFFNIRFLFDILFIVGIYILAGTSIYNLLQNYFYRIEFEKEVKEKLNKILEKL